jgi:hypothetical protein
VTANLVHPILTEAQATLVHQALIAFLNTPEGNLSENPGEETLIRKELSELVYFFSEVVEHPEGFGLRSEKATQAIIRENRRSQKGPAQPQSGRNKRKARQEARQGGHKQRRKQRREYAEQQKEAMAKMEADLKEAQEAYEAAQKKLVDRFEALATKDTLTNEEVQEVIEMFGSPEGAAKMRELRAENDPQKRLDNAAAAATQ